MPIKNYSPQKAYDCSNLLTKHTSLNGFVFATDFDADLSIFIHCRFPQKPDENLDYL